MSRLPRLTSRLETNTTFTMASQTMSFADSAPQIVRAETVEGANYHARSGQTTSNLADFLARPIRIHTFDWVPNTTIHSNLYPWHEFLNNDNVRDKLSHYSRLRGTLKLKIILNGNGFYFGRIIVSYLPIPTADQVSKINASSPARFLSVMQRPRIVLDPTNAEGGEMTLPFMWPNDWLDLTNSEAESMGRLAVDDLNRLQHANGDPSPITVSMFAWMEDVELMMPTTQAISVASRETEKVSDKVDRAADLAAVVSDAPTIGPYAKATEMALRMGARMARAAGFSRVDSGHPSRYVPTYVNNIASGNEPEQVVKLTVDNKQEVSIDPRIVGIAEPDPLVVSDLVQRPGYYGTFQWTPAKDTDDLLWNVAVRPDVYARGGATGEYHFTPIGYFSLPFSSWRGDMVYSFEVVASTFHRGRLRITWDPVEFDETGAMNETYSVVVDISTTRKFDITVPYGATRPYTNINHLSGSWWGNTKILLDKVNTNGVLSVFVLNELTGSNTATGDNIVELNCFVRGGPNFELARLTEDKLTELSPFISVSSRTVEKVVASTNDVGTLNNVECVDVAGESSQKWQDVVSYGDTFDTFRQMLRRYEYWTAREFRHVATNATTATRYTLPAFPCYRGYDPNGEHPVGLGSRFNYVKFTLLHLMTLPFLARRGSIRRKFIGRMLAGDANASPLMSVGNSVQPNGGYAYNVNTQLYAESSLHGRAAAMDTVTTSGLSGRVITPMELQPTLEIEAPYYNPQRFICARSLDVNTTSQVFANDNTLDLTITSSSTGGTTNGWVSDYGSIGEDFSVTYYVSTPILYKYSSPLPA